MQIVCCPVPAFAASWRWVSPWLCRAGLRPGRGIPRLSYVPVGSRLSPSTFLATIPPSPLGVSPHAHEVRKQVEGASLIMPCMQILTWRVIEAMLKADLTACRYSWPLARYGWICVFKGAIGGLEEVLGSGTPTGYREWCTAHSTDTETPPKYRPHRPATELQRVKDLQTSLLLRGRYSRLRSIESELRAIRGTGINRG
jgi:hypothetical protein